MSKIKNYKPLSKLVYEEVRNRILNGEYTPNQSLVASELSREFEVSVIPIREAFRLLENEGLLTGVPNKSITVSDYDIEDIRQIYSVRKILESHAARLAAKDFPKESLRSLKKLFSEMERHLMGKHYRRYFENNTLFHQILCKESGNKWLCTVIFDLWGKSRRSNAAIQYDTDHRARMMAGHRLIINAIETGKDPSEVEAVVAEHVETAMRGVIAYFERIEFQAPKAGQAGK